MAAWRRKALQAFPSLRNDLNNPQYNTYGLFLDLLIAAHSATRAGRTQELSKILAFAEWCLKQKAKELWNPAGVVFFEDLFDGPDS
jgi:hypothetical protein